MQKKFVLLEDDESIVKNLTEELKITELTAKILFHRGITNINDAENFLNPDKQSFNDPFLMKGMNQAVERILKAIDKDEKIIVYGDYDVDGMTATSILVRALKKLNAQVKFYIPAREEGYGINANALKILIEDNAKLLISVDCGITNHKEIYQFKDQIDFIITDHHLPTEPLNDIIVVNPHQQGCNYPDKNLCGAGVAFKLCQALNNNFNDYFDDIELAALGTVADIVPLIGENRKIVYHGLKLMDSTKNLGLRELMKVSEVNGKKINTNTLGFKIAPRLNATGRLSTASTGVKLLTTSDESTAKDIAKNLNHENEERKTLENKIIYEAEQKYIQLRKIKNGDMSSIIVASENWHAGVIGLAASRLLEKHYLPTIVLSIQGEFSRASCRSIHSLNMKETLDHFKNFFTQYGGHSAAAGFTIRTEDLKIFSEEFDSYVKNILSDEDFIPLQYVDAFINPSMITFDNVNELEKISPFGVNNPQPVFACQNISASSPKIIGQDKKHLSFKIKDIRAVAWNSSKFFSMIGNEKLDLIFEPSINDFDGYINIQAVIKSINPSKNIFPNRDKLLEIYKFLLFNSSKKFNELFNLEYSFSTYDLLCAVDIFEELGLFQFNGDGFIMPKSNRKLNLNESRIWRLNNER